jgi:hypothetical protein
MMVLLLEMGIMVYTVTHMIGMTSTITNPVLYAFLNENFTKEFRYLRTLSHKNKTDET